MSQEKLKVGEFVQADFIIDFEMGRRLIMTVAPDKFTETTKKFVLRNEMSKSYLVALNEDGIAEYLVELEPDRPEVVNTSNYKETLEEMIQEKNTYQKILVRSSIVAVILVAACLGLVVYLKYFC